MEDHLHPVSFGEWIVLQTLGEGAYGEVKLLFNRKSNDELALKILDIARNNSADKTVMKEIRIHQCVEHPSIIKLFGHRKVTPTIYYVFLEFASGGELFNRIEPDVGMSNHEAQKYMKQLLAGVQYLHDKGIVHRDIKPENLLLDANGNLKISDFGMATIFRLRGKERYLNNKCGTLPYVAPEVLMTRYKAIPCDIWSCGIVLVTLLAGELPWDEPTYQCPEFIRWGTDQYLLATPWSKIRNLGLSLIRKMLTISPADRPTIPQILKHPWMNEKLDLTETSQWDKPTVTLSQPVRPTVDATTPVITDLDNLLKPTESVCFSLPALNESLILGSQFSFTQTTQNPFHRLVKRMTRFFVGQSYEKTVEMLRSTFDKLNYASSIDTKGVFTVSTVDSHRMQLVFKATLISMDGRLLVDFRLSKGCGLEFKRRFVKIKGSLESIIEKN